MVIYEKDANGQTQREIEEMFEGERERERAKRAALKIRVYDVTFVK